MAGFESRYLIRRGSLELKSLSTETGSYGCTDHGCNTVAKHNAGIMNDSVMWLLPLHELVGLAKLESHEELMKHGKLAQWDPSMRYVFVISHQWLGNTHPDPTSKHLRTLQELFLHFMNGDQCAHTVPDFLSRHLLPKHCQITPRDWKGIVEKGRVFVWSVSYELFSPSLGVPQRCWGHFSQD